MKLIKDIFFILLLTISFAFSKSNFSLDLGADSLDTAELVMSLEDEFDIEILDIDATDIHTVKEACDYIEERLNA